MLYNIGRRNGKQYMLTCERISELDLQIDFARKFGLEYSDLIIERNKLIRELDGGVDVETSSKKTKNKNRRLF